jgi:hypothetical protein
MKVSFLSREQEIKKCFIQFGKKSGIPLDIVKWMYNYIREYKEKERVEPCIFYKNMTLMHCLDSYGNSGRPSGPCERVGGYYREDALEKLRGVSPKVWELVDGVWVKNVDELSKVFFIQHYIHSWIGKYNYYTITDQVGQGNDCMKDDLYEHMVPDGKGCEWGIKNSRLSRRMELAVGEDCPRFYDLREKLMAEIIIIGEEKYLVSKEKYKNFQIVDDDRHVSFASLRPVSDVYCSLRQKILYLNTSPWNEIEFDYENFLEYKDSMPNEWRIFVDQYGDSSFL